MADAMNVDQKPATMAEVEAKMGKIKEDLGFIRDSLGRSFKLTGSVALIINAWVRLNDSNPHEGIMNFIVNYKIGDYDIIVESHQHTLKVHMDNLRKLVKAGFVITKNQGSLKEYLEKLVFSTINNGIAMVHPSGIKIDYIGQSYTDLETIKYQVGDGLFVEVFGLTGLKDYEDKLDEFDYPNGIPQKAIDKYDIYVILKTLKIVKIVKRKREDNTPNEPSPKRLYFHNKSTFTTPTKEYSPESFEYPPESFESPPGGGSRKLKKTKSKAKTKRKSKGSSKRRAKKRSGSKKTKTRRRKTN